MDCIRSNKKKLFGRAIYSSHKKIFLNLSKISIEIIIDTYNLDFQFKVFINEYLH